MATTLRWTGPTAYTDGRPYGQADHGGYDIEINGTLSVSIPFGWNAENVYSVQLADLSGVNQGDNTARVRTVAANGQVSEWTPSVTFQFLSIPQAPTALAAV